MQRTGLTLPGRTAKPRTIGLTVLIDPGLPAHQFADVIESAESIVDLLKFGWGTSVVSDQLEEKTACLRAHDIGYFFGGTLFEKFYQQRKLSAYRDYCERLGRRRLHPAVSN